MKMKFLTVALFLGIMTSINAQDKNNLKSNGGIKGGYNLAAVNYEDGNGDTEQRHSFHVGFYGEGFVNDNISIQPELLYSQQGYVVTYNDGSKFTQKLNYINMPLMFKAYPSQNFFLEVGPQIGLAISHKEEFKSGSSSLFNTSSSEEFDPNNFDWGFNFGAGFKTDSGVSLGVRYHLGMGDLYDNNQKAKNRVWQFSIGFDL